MDKKAKNITIFLLGILPALFAQIIGAYFYFIAFAGTGFAQILYAGVKVFIFAWPIFWYFVAFKPAKFENRDLKCSIFWGMVTGLLIGGVILDSYFLFRDYFDSYHGVFYEKVRDFNIESYYLYVGIVFSIFHSLLEEYYWRWFVLKGLMLKMPFWPAAIIGSAAFAGHHYIVLSQFFDPVMTGIFGTAVGVGGLIWCYLYKTYGSIIGPWISHFWVDRGLVLVGYYVMFA